MAETAPRSRWVTVAGFLYLWLIVGFVLGTFVLVGPVRWITDVIHGWGWGQTAEDWTLRITILVYVLVAVLLARALNRRMLRTPSKGVRFGIPVVATVLALATVKAWANPGALLAGLAGGTRSEISTASGTVFLFGPYPDDDRLASLKKEGVTTVISLQSPAVPVERSGIAAENVAVKQLGLNIIHLPMLPWVSENQAALDSLRKIAKNGKGKFYVHCGLGRDRVNVAKRILEASGAATTPSKGYMHAVWFPDRGAHFERGPLYAFADSIWMVPYPNKDEMYGFVLQGSPAREYFLLDPNDPAQKPMITEVKGLLPRYQITDYEVIEVKPTDKARIVAVVDSIKRRHKPVAIVVAFTPVSDADNDPKFAMARTVMALYGFQGPPRTNHWWSADDVKRGGLTPEAFALETAAANAK